MKNVRRKMRARQGLTLVETLAAVIVLTLLCLALNSGLNLTVHAYRSLISESETQLLLSTAADALTTELRFAFPWSNNLEDAEEALLGTYQSQEYGFYSNIMIGEDDGHLYVSNSSGDHPLLSSGVYGKDGVYKLSLPQGILYNKKKHIFTFTLRAEGQSFAEQEFTVYCINGGYEL